MKNLLKWTGFSVAALASVALMAYACIYLASEREVGRAFAAPAVTKLVIPTDAPAIAEGERIARLAGCLHCHGDSLQGSVVDDIPHLVRLVAPNISVMLPEYSDEELVTMLRTGVKRDGKSVLFMPSEMYRHLADEDVARLVAWLRTMPARPSGVHEHTQLRVVGRLLLVKGGIRTAASAIPTLPPISAVDRGDRVSVGRKLTMSFCSECHGQNLEGFAPINAPPLAVVKGYSVAQFTRLLREGIPNGERELKLMGPTSRARFAHFLPEEIEAVHAFLQTQ